MLCVWRAVDPLKGGSEAFSEPVWHLNRARCCFGVIYVKCDTRLGDGRVVWVNTVRDKSEIMHLSFMCSRQNICG